MNYFKRCILSVAIVAAFVAPSVQSGDTIARLSSNDPKERSQAAVALGMAGNVAAVPHLIKLLTDYPPDQKPDYSLPFGTPSWEAHEALVRIGKKAVPQLVEALGGKDARIVARVCRILGLIGDERAVSPMLPLLDAREADVRAHAASALARMSRHLDSLDPLIRACNDPHPLVTRYAVEGLGFTKDERAEVSLLAILLNPAHRNRADACMSLARLKCQKAVPFLLPLLEGPDNVLRWKALYALGELEALEAVKPIIQILNTRGLHCVTYVGCVRALISLRSPEALDAATTVFDWDDPYLPSIAVESFAKLNEEAHPYLARALCAKNAKAQAAAVQAFARLLGPRFDEGGKEWFVWLEEHRRKQGSFPTLADVQSTPVPATEHTKLVRVREFGVEEQTGTGQFLVTNGRLIASVTRYVDLPPGTANSHSRDPRRRLSATMVAWDLKGHLLWQTSSYPGFHRMCMAGGMLLLAVDDGTQNGKRELIWIDPENGREVQRIDLPGRPGTLAFNAHSETVILVMFPQRRLETLEGAWMEVRSYRSSGELAWMRKEEVTELDGLSLDGPVVVVGSRSAGRDFLAGLDAITGKEAWRRRWGYFPSVPEAGSSPPESMTGLAMIPGWQGAEFVDSRSGKTVAAMPIASGMPKATTHKDRLHFTKPDLNGFTTGAYAWPSGKPIWADKTNTVCCSQPVAWGENVVFLARRLSNGLTGHVTLTELRVYGPQGHLLCWSPREKDHWTDTATPVVDGEYLYAIDGRKIVAFELKREE